MEETGGRKPCQDRESLEQTRSLLEAVLDQSPVAMVVVSLPNMVVQHINRAAVEGLGIADEPSLLGLPLAEVRSRQSWRDLASDDSPTKPGALPLERALGGESTTNVEFGVLRKDGTRRWFVGSGAPIRNTEGILDAGVLAFRDVTEHRHTVERLRQLADEQRTILDTVSAGICHLKNGRIQWVNHAFESIFGLASEELCGQDIARFYAYPEDHDRVSRDGRECLSAGVVYETEVLLRRKSGEFFWCHVAGRAVNPQQTDESSIWVLQDIASRKQAEAALLESQARLDAAQEQAHIGSWEHGPGPETGFWSSEMFRLLGLPPSPVPPPLSEFLAMIHPDDRDRFLSMDREARQTDEICSVEFRSAPDRGPPRTFASTMRARRDSSGKLLRMAGTLQDVTERRRVQREQERLQEQLQQAVKMEAVGRLAGGVAHDFNNLLTVIAGNVDLAKMEISPTDPLRQYLDQVSTSASSAAELTRQLLAFSRRQMIEPRVLDLNEIIGALRKMLGRLIGEDITMETVLAPELGAVKADAGQIDQVIVNLAVNARDAMPKGGRLVIETANVEIDQAWCELHPGLKPGRFVMLAVSDTGHGMSREVRARIFEPFFTTKPKGRGTGLGLAMIFSVVSQAGGAIDVYSEVGHGTVFKIYLPRVDEPLDTLGGKLVDSAPARGDELVLLVEDDPSVRELSTTFLRRQGYRVVVSQNGSEALAYAEKNHGPIDILLTDVVLPGMNGRELAERIRLLHPETAVLFASGYTEDTILRTGVMSDRFHFITKPYSLQAIAHKVREVLEAHRRASGG
jgi:two-component system, cell cycle sensor histidine kinase and response regulator CckA